MFLQKSILRENFLMFYILLANAIISVSLRSELQEISSDRIYTLFGTFK